MILRLVDGFADFKIVIGLPMSELDVQPNEDVAAPSNFSSRARFLWRQLPYAVALVLAVAGVAYTNISHQPLLGYWEFLAIAVGVVCVITKWPELDGKQARLRLLWTQAAHWAAVLIAMNSMLVSRVQQLMPPPATSFCRFTCQSQLATGQRTIAQNAWMASNVSALPVPTNVPRSVPTVGMTTDGSDSGDDIGPEVP